MDMLDVITGVLTIGVVIAALLFPINRSDDDKKDE